MYAAGGWLGLMGWNADRGWKGAGALERISDTKVELIEDCVMLFLGFVGILVGMVDDFGTPRFNAGGGRWEDGRRGGRMGGERREERNKGEEMRKERRSRKKRKKTTSS